MKSISLYVDKDTYLTRMHPFAKLCYIFTAIVASLVAGKLWAFAAFIGISLVMLISGKIIRKVFPLIAFSFTILITIFLIHGLFNHEKATLLFAAGPLKFYQEGMLYALRISLNVLNMLLAFAVFVLTTRPVELVEDLERIGFSPKIGYVVSSVFQIVSFAWAGFGATFGPVVLVSLFWKGANRYGVLAGMVSGGVMIFLWKYVIAKLGGVFAIYELLPAFIVAVAVIVVVSLVTGGPEQEVLEKFEQVKAQN